jgi:hypothetical protein
MRVGFSSGMGWVFTRVTTGSIARLDADRATDAVAAGAEAGVASPIACWKNAFCAARTSGEAAGRGVAAGITGGLKGRMTGGMTIMVNAR